MKQGVKWRCGRKVRIRTHLIPGPKENGARGGGRGIAELRGSEKAAGYGEEAMWSGGA